MENLGDALGFGGSRNDPVSFVMGDSVFVGLGNYGFSPTQYSDEFSTYFVPNELPIDLTISNNLISENDSVGTFVAKLFTTDPDNNFPFYYELIEANSDNNKFYITNDSLFTADIIDFEETSELELSVRTTDNRGGSFSQTFTIFVNDVM